MTFLDMRDCAELAQRVLVRMNAFVSSLNPKEPQNEWVLWVLSEIVPVCNAAEDLVRVFDDLRPQLVNVKREEW